MYSIWDHQEHLVAISNLPINVPNVFQYMCLVSEYILNTSVRFGEHCEYTQTIEENAEHM